ncbi:MAG: AMIN domain-containing protein [Limnospira sp. PMC 737.11]|uniref:AMIN domain-containing protein n=1 Tax=Limnospira sp. PMC 737.11 TaxID=2981095 RepID=UPI0028E0CD3F|nr:AMIN domain-containing protein [Limnospira sp. PMC 737.11]MDT9275730.1 AMIN domain-containing protein [Limnospira sp. PMC 737.11]
MRDILGFGGGVAGGVAAAMVVAVAPALAFTVVRDIQLFQADNGEINLVLVTDGGERPAVFVIRRGNDFVADITNAQLSSPNGSFQQNNPAPGIASIVVNQLDPTSIRVIVTGTTGSPEARIIQGAGDAIAIAIAPEGAIVDAPAFAPQQPGNGASQVMVPDPPVSITGDPTAQNGNNDMMMPDPALTPQMGQAPLQPRRSLDTTPPFQPRAVAPPLGDIAVSNINPGVSNVNLNTNEIIPRLVLRDASVREVLSLLARVAGLNVAFSNLEKDPNTGRFRPGNEEQEFRISLDIENEPVQEVFNYVLRLTGLQANRVGNTVFVGFQLPESAQNLVMRTLRMNQTTAEGAANYLSSQGAETQIPFEQVEIQVVGQGINQRIVETRTPSIIAVGAAEGQGPLLLRGLSVTADSRLNSVTLVGPPEKVEIATAMLMQLDLRQRQVAVNVKIIDVNLTGEATQSSSFSFGINDTFFVNDGGAASINFGGINPPTRGQATDGVTSRPIVPNPLSEQDPFFDRDSTIRTPLTAPGGGIGLRPIPPVTERPGGVGLSDYEPFTRDLTDGSLTGLGSTTASVFPFFQYPRRFLSTLQAQIVSGRAKILTDPTLVVQEGETASVELIQEVLQSSTTIFTDTISGTRQTIQGEVVDVGLTLSVNVERIDDNGFVTMRINPEVSSPGTQVPVGNNSSFLRVFRRSLDSGRIRLRDGQTLIVSGIIQDQERTDVSKIPLLGDLPIVGSLFRRSNTSSERAEVIVLVTPNILDDSDRSGFGYQNNFSPDVRQMMQGR